MRNIEIKMPLPDRAGTERRLAALGATRTWVRRQRDTFFEVPRGFLKMREVEGEPAELISYRREDGVSDYDVRPLDDAAAWKGLLGRVLPAGPVVAKERTLWMWRHTRVHLDEVDGLGAYLELETVVDGITAEEGRRECEEVIDALALDRDSFLDVPYRALLS